ncbi:BTB/POZ domain-containing protein 9-like protein, partial [Leptotrombidium deliense]
MYRRSGNNRFIDNLRLQEFANYLLTNEHDDRDFTFVVENNEITCHKLIVKHASDGLRKKFSEWEKLKEPKVTLTNVSYKVFTRLMGYIYTALFNYRGLNDKDALELLKIANDFELVELCSEICSEVESKGFLSIWTVSKFMKMANDFRFQDLHNTCIKFMDDHSLEVIVNNTYLDIPANLLVLVLNRDTFYSKEIEIFKAVKAWLDKNSETVTDEDKTSLLATVRLNYITESEFEAIV